jgi:hypothetical protein
VPGNIAEAFHTMSMRFARLRLDLCPLIGLSQPPEARQDGQEARRGATCMPPCASGSVSKVCKHCDGQRPLAHHRQLQAGAEICLRRNN